MSEAIETQPKQQGQGGKGGVFAIGCAVGAASIVTLELLGAIALFIFAQQNVSSMVEKNLRPPDLPGGTFDYSWTFTNAAGEVVTLADFAGHVAVLTLWKPGCPACEAEMGSLTALANAVEPYGVMFAMICALPTDDLAGDAAAIGISLPVYGPDGEIPRPIYPLSAPATYIIDGTGKIRAKKTGGAAWDDESVVVFIEALVADQAVPGRAE